MARSICYVGFHLQVDASGSSRREHPRAFGELQSNIWLNDKRPRPFALGALDITKQHRPGDLNSGGIDAQMEMCAQQWWIFRKPNVQLIRNGVSLTLLGFAQPVRLRHRL